MSGKVVLMEYVDLFTTWQGLRPPLQHELPTKLIRPSSNGATWCSTYQTMEQIKELETWVKYGPVLYNDWGMGRKLKPGYRACSTALPAPARPDCQPAGKVYQRDV